MAPAPVSSPFVASGRGKSVAGDGMLHPVVIGAVAMLIANDQFLKSVAPGVVTGKLSDVAGLLFFPLLIVAAVEIVAALRGRWRQPSDRVAVAAVVATGLVFAAVKLFPAAEGVYELLLGIIQWPFQTAAALLAGRAAGPPVAVELSRDPTDLVALAALWVPFHLGRRRAEGRDEAGAAGLHEAATVRPYDFVVAALSVVLLVGATLDGWAHSHDRLALESLITPWHAVVYLGFTAVAVVVLAPPLTGWLGGQGARASIRAGFGISVAGVVLFAATGAADALWHLAFGIEADAEALLSPTHLGLGLTAAMIASGPVRAAWLRPESDGGSTTWPAFLPAALSVVAMVGLVAFALHIANLFVDPWPRFPYGRADLIWYGPNIGVASAIVQTGVLMTPILLLLRRWRELPAGTLTLVIGGATAGLTFLHDQGELVGAPILAGFLADLVLLAVRPGAPGAWRLPAVGFLVPVAIFVAYFVVLDATGPVAWSAHLIGGTVVLAGGTGFALALLAGRGSLQNTPR
jgi:hypothetical protein